MLNADDFRAFRNECIELRILYRTYADLYEADAQTQSLLHAAAPHFFHNLNGWLIDLLFVKISRLLEPAKTLGRQNLTVKTFVEDLEGRGASTQELLELAERLKKYGDPLRHARNKVVAHADLASIRSGEVLGIHEPEDVQRFFADLHRFIDLISVHFDAGRLEWLGTSSSAGGLIATLRKVKAPLSN